MKSNKGKKKNLISLFLLAFLAIGLTVAGMVFYNNWQQDRAVHKDQLRFAEANKKKHQVFSDLVKRIGAPLDIEEKNVCYNSEQGPFDNGHLWCQVASAAYFSRAVQDGEIERQFVEALVDNGIAEKTAGGLWFDGAKDLTCRLDILSGKFADAPGYYFPSDAASKQTVVLRCVDRALDKHYPYID